MDTYEETARKKKKSTKRKNKEGFYQHPINNNVAQGRTLYVHQHQIELEDRLDGIFDIEK